jgi:uncharacterized protein involved in exopolysaccharide biosynthesis
MKENKDMLNKNKFKKDQIYLIGLLKTLINGRRKIIKITLIFAFIGLFIAIFSEKEYTASTTIVPQVSNLKSLGGSLGSLAAIARIDIGGSSSNDASISPLLYPYIINSVPFQKELLATPLTILDYDRPVTFQEYYTEIYQPGLLSKIKKYTIGLPVIILRAIKGKSTKTFLKLIDVNSQIVQITRDEKQLIERLKNQLTLLVNKKEGYVSLSASMPKAVNAAELAQNAQELLQKYILDFKVERSKNKLRFIKERFEEKEKTYKETQTKLALFQDRNQFINSALAKNTQMRYQADYDLAFVVYSELAKQQETQLIKVKEDTPIFTILEPVSIPSEKSNPQRFLILLIWSFLGVTISVFFILSKSYITQFMSKIRMD